MIAEARGEVMGFSNFFMPVNPNMMRKRRAVAGNSWTPNNKIPSAADLAWFQANMAETHPHGTNESASAKKPPTEQGQLQLSCGHEQGEEEFYDPELNVSP